MATHTRHHLISLPHMFQSLRRQPPPAASLPFPRRATYHLSAHPTLAFLSSPLPRFNRSGAFPLIPPPPRSPLFPSTPHGFNRSGAIPLMATRQRIHSTR